MCELKRYVVRQCARCNGRGYTCSEGTAHDAGYDVVECTACDELGRVAEVHAHGMTPPVDPVGELRDVIVRLNADVRDRASVSACGIHEHLDALELVRLAVVELQRDLQAQRGRGQL
jgi:hypothetical protein